MIREVQTEDKSVLVVIATEILEPLYGNQDKALEGWFEGKHNKKTFVATVDGEIAGLLCLKVRKGKITIKISTLLVLDRYQGKGVGCELLTFALEYASINCFSEIKVTVSEEKPESLAFFLKHGFKINQVIEGKYIPGINENILFREM